MVKKVFVAKNNKAVAERGYKGFRSNKKQPKSRKYYLPNMQGKYESTIKQRDLTNYNSPIKYESTHRAEVRALGSAQRLYGHEILSLNHNDRRKSKKLVSSSSFSSFSSSSSSSSSSSFKTTSSSSNIPGRRIVVPRRAARLNKSSNSFSSTQQNEKPETAAEKAIRLEKELAEYHTEMNPELQGPILNSDINTGIIPNETFKNGDQTLYSWRLMFQVTTKQEVEVVLHDANCTFQWLSGDQLEILTCGRRKYFGKITEKFYERNVDLDISNTELTCVINKLDAIAVKHLGRGGHGFQFNKQGKKRKAELLLHEARE